MVAQSFAVRIEIIHLNNNGITKIFISCFTVEVIGLRSHK